MATAQGTSPLWIPSNFLALPEEQSSLPTSPVVILPAPYDSTTSYRTGARDGPSAIIEASYNLEDYDPELGIDVAEIGIYTSPRLEPQMAGPRSMIDRVREAVDQFLSMGKLVGVLGGEHSLTTGSVEALSERYPDLRVLFLDAHGDLREEYMGTKWGHGSVARRVSELCPLVHVGGRSFSKEEVDHIESAGLPTFTWPPAGGHGIPQPADLDVESIVSLLGPHVYVSVDLDVLDPAIMSAVGTPEPGGLGWFEILSLLRRVGETCRVVGFDVMELSPRQGPDACSYLAAKLVYKLIAYSTLYKGDAT